MKSCGLLSLNDEQVLQFSPVEFRKGSVCFDVRDMKDEIHPSYGKAFEASGPGLACPLSNLFST